MNTRHLIQVRLQTIQNINFKVTFILLFNREK